jgi:hypothetical protein
MRYYEKLKTKKLNHFVPLLIASGVQSVGLRYLFKHENFLPSATSALRPRISVDPEARTEPVAESSLFVRVLAVDAVFAHGLIAVQIGKRILAHVGPEIKVIL